MMMVWDFFHEIVNLLSVWWIVFVPIVFILVIVAAADKRRVSVRSAVAVTEKLFHAIDDSEAFESITDSIFNQHCLSDYFILFVMQMICSQNGVLATNLLYENFDKCFRLAGLNEHEIASCMEYIKACTIIMLCHYRKLDISIVHGSANDYTTEQFTRMRDFAYSLVMVLKKAWY